MPDKLVEVMVDSVFRKNGIKPEEVKNNLSEKQREMLKEMVTDLKQQVEEFQQKGMNLKRKSSDFENVEKINYFFTFLCGSKNTMMLFLFL